MKTLYCDGEGGLTCKEAKAILKNIGTGTGIRIKAPNQHASIIEQRNAVLRHAMHIMHEELERHDVQLRIESLLAQAVFFTNAFTFINGVSPINAHSGRQPPCLPDLPNLDFEDQEEGEELLGERERRVREAGLAAIIQSTATAKINRALKARTTADGFKLYQAGQLVDYYRQPEGRGKKEMSGWHGPYRVISNLPEAAQVKIQVANQEIRAQYPDVRLTLFLEACVFMANIRDTPQALTEVVTFVGQLQPGAPPLTFGTRICGSLTSAPRFDRF